MHENFIPPLPGTLRIIGLVVVLGGRALDLALVETDGRQILRRIDLERVPLGAGATGKSIPSAVLTFMGDRALQPFAVDCLALGVGTLESIAVALRQHLGVWTMIVKLDRTWPHLPEAERVALAAVPHYQAEIARGCAITAD